MTWRHMGSGIIAPPFLTSAVDGEKWSASSPCRFTPGEWAPDTHWTGGWLSPWAGLGAVETRKILHCRESNPSSPAHSYTDWAIPNPVFKNWIGGWVGPWTGLDAMKRGKIPCSAGTGTPNLGHWNRSLDASQTELIRQDLNGPHYTRLMTRWRKR
jgi:hypothetical protein